MTVLVAVATAHGSTRAIAERLGSRLQRAGLDVVIRSAGDEQDVDAYEAVVIGSAIHGGRWLSEATSFAQRCQAALRDRPVWLFSVSTLGDEEAMFAPAVARRLRALRKETPELLELRRTIQPVEHRNFAGVVKPADWPLSGRLFFRSTGGRYGDHRNWSAIEAWGDQIATEVRERGGTAASPSRARDASPGRPT